VLQERRFSACTASATAAKAGSHNSSARGLRRTRLRGLPGAQTWIGGIALAHNLQRMAALTCD
jgi:hypothetical protein